MLGLKMMLCDDVAAIAAGFVHQQSVSQCATTPPVDTQPPDWQTPLNGIISLRERL